MVGPGRFGPSRKKEAAARRFGNYDRRKQTAQADTVRSAETTNASESEVHTARLSPVPAALIRSAESVSTKIPGAEQLSRRLDEFVSQNTEALPSQPLDLLKEVA